MTRYQMGKYIQTFLENYKKEHGPFGRKNELAFDLLTYIEELGMRPPYDASQDDGVDTMEWEPEEYEKK